MNENVITSLQNGKVKRLVLLQQKSAERRKAGVFVVEGQREIEHCLEAGYELDSMFWCPSLMAARRSWPGMQCRTRRMR